MIGNHPTHYSVRNSERIFEFDPRDPLSKTEAFNAAQSHDRARRRALEDRAGRPITDDEFFNNRVDHPEDREFIQVHRDENFSPTLKDQPSRYDKARAELVEEIEREKYRRLSPNEQRLHDLDKMEAEQDAEAAEAEARKRYLASSRVRAALKELNGVLDDMKFDPSRTKSELAAVENAIAQWSEPKGDSAVAESMLRGILDSEDARTEAQNAANREKIAALESQIREVRGDTPPAKVSVDRQQPIALQLVDLETEIFGKGYAAGVWEEITAADAALKEGNEEPALALMEKYTAEPAGTE